jgi:hypothetical protein
MFSEMITGLQCGVMPDLGPLKGRCRAALSKKLAIVSQPPTYWIDDPKRNPLTEHLLWAILLTGDTDLLDVIIGIVLMEQEELGGMEVESFIQQSVSNLLALAPDEKFLKQLKYESALTNQIR